MTVSVAISAEGIKTDKIPDKTPKNQNRSSFGKMIDFSYCNANYQRAFLISSGCIRLPPRSQRRGNLKSLRPPRQITRTRNSGSPRRFCDPLEALLLVDRITPHIIRCSSHDLISETRYYRSLALECGTACPFGDEPQRDIHSALG